MTLIDALLNSIPSDVTKLDVNGTPVHLEFRIFFSDYRLRCGFCTFDGNSYEFEKGLFSDTWLLEDDANTLEELLTAFHNQLRLNFVQTRSTIRGSLYYLARQYGDDKYVDKIIKKMPKQSQSIYP
jgi:hypothetical protein